MEASPAAPVRGAKPSRVALFATCVADIVAPGPAAATVELLEACGVEVSIPRSQSCCGQPALSSGFPEQAAQLARHWLRVFADQEMIVTPSGSCAAMVHHHFPRLLRGAEREDARAAAARTCELSQFLAAFGDTLHLRLDGVTVTYHDSCHMLRSLGEARTPRAVLDRIAGLELVEMADTDLCCGFGGTFSTKLPEVSVAMADGRLSQAEETQADYLVSSDEGCLLHLRERAAAVGRPVRTRHLAELVRDALVDGGR